jgi:hypothetical protein
VTRANDGLGANVAGLSIGAGAAGALLDDEQEVAGLDLLALGEGPLLQEALDARHQIDRVDRLDTKVPAGVTLLRAAAATATAETDAAAGAWSAFCERPQPQSAAPKMMTAATIPPPGGRRSIEIPRRNSLKAARPGGASSGRAAAHRRENRVNGRGCVRWLSQNPRRPRRA